MRTTLGVYGAYIDIGREMSSRPRRDTLHEKEKNTPFKALTEFSFLLVLLLSSKSLPYFSLSLPPVSS